MQRRQPATTDVSQSLQARRRLLAAAVQVAADRGIDGLTLADVGLQAGYSRGLPTQYFGKKDRLIAALARYIQDRFASGLGPDSTAHPGLKSLLHWVAQYFNSALQAPAETRAYQIALIEAISEPLIARSMRDVTRTATDRLKINLRAGIQRGEIRRNIDPDAEAVTILGTARASMALWATDPDTVDLATLRDSYILSLKRNLSA